MRLWTILLTGTLVLAFLAPNAVADAECAEGESCPQETDDSTTGNATDGTDTNTTTEDTGRGANENARSSRDKERAERLQEGKRSWEQSPARQSGPGQNGRGASAEHIPDQLRDRLGQLTSENGAVRGTFVTFDPDEQLGLLQQVTHEGTVLFQEIYVPADLGEPASVRTFGKDFMIRGDGWRYQLVDHETVSMQFLSSTEAPFLVVLPAEATLSEVPNGFAITYPAADGTSRAGILRGDATIDPADPQTLLLSRASFHLLEDRVLLPGVTNQARAAIDQALAEGDFGAEVTLLQMEQEEVFVDSTVYTDLELLVEQFTETTAESHLSGYTITVDSPTHTGKTIAVAFQAGLIEPDGLMFRYYNVEAEATIEAPIVMASSLQDVLDPLDDGTVAEYWIVEDADGVQVLISVPHFSVHQIQLLSLADIIVEHPSLVLGTIGAVLLVAVATAGMFRRPEEEA